MYTQAWQALAVAVSGDEAGAAMLTTIANNTLAVLGPVPERRSEWRSALVGLRNQATATGDRPLAAFVDAVLALPLAAFVDAVLALLDAGGDATGLGQGLAGIYGVVWQAIVEGLGA